MIELHGNTRYAKCLDCGARWSWPIRAHFDPWRCRPIARLWRDREDGDHFLRPGHAGSGNGARRGGDLACDLFLVLGSSLVVYPAAGFPLLARRKGARLVIVNREPTEQDPYADLVLHSEIGANHEAGC